MKLIYLNVLCALTVKCIQFSILKMRLIYHAVAAHARSPKK